MKKRSTHKRRRIIRNHNRRLIRIYWTLRMHATIPQLLECRQSTQKAQRRPGRQQRRAAVARHIQRVPLASLPEGFDRLLLYGLRSCGQRELELCEHGRARDRRRVVRAPAHYESLQFVLHYMRLCARDRAQQVRRGTREPDADVERRRELEEGGAGLQGARNGPECGGGRGEEEEGGSP